MSTVVLRPFFSGGIARGTIRHSIPNLNEIAHAIVGRAAGHGPVWRAKCLEIGGDGRRCKDDGEADMPKGRWRATCPGCKQTYHRFKRPKRLTGWHCKSCGPQRGALVWQVPF